ASQTFAGSKYHTAQQAEEADTEAAEEEEEEECDEEDSAESGSSSSFSLQECINEFRARRIRRVSARSDRDMPEELKTAAAGGGVGAAGDVGATPADEADAHLINQNLCNKAQERRGKPCQNGFCYCFTSDSGDCGSTAPPPRDWHVRQHKRSRRAETNKQSQRQAQQARRQASPSKQQPQPQQSARPLTAVSSLQAVGEDAPLIHIIQELRDNCVISEVRVNRQKLPAAAAGSSAGSSPRSTCLTTSKRRSGKPKPHAECIEYKPTAPLLSNISEQETPLEDVPAGASSPSTRRSSSRRSSSGAGGRLLQKRLSSGQVNFKIRDTQLPPPKPPRRSSQSLDGKFSLSSLTSTTPSVRDAERVLDEFLRKHGVQLPSSAREPERSTQTKSKRKSYPLAEVEKPARGLPLPTCPSLSDLERVVESKRGVHYAKNIQMESRKNVVADKPMKEIMLGWTEPKINEMLNYDSSKLSQLKSQAPQPAPQVPSIGWQLPLGPKISLDTVDGVSTNLAVNMQQKQTPIKYPRLPTNAPGSSSSQKFIWGEQWRNLSPWSGGKKRAGLRNKSKKFLNNSKNKILRFVSPKKSNQQERQQPVPRLCTVGVQTSSSQLQLDLLQSQSPPGSYHSPVQTTPSGTTTTMTGSTRRQYNKQSSELEQQPYFDFERKVEAPAPSKKLPRTQRARKLNFQTESIKTNSTAAPTPTTYRSFHKDLDQDVTHTKMSYLLSSIRAKLEASDDRASRTFRECTQREPAANVDFDCIDGPQPRRPQRRQRQLHEREPIYSEIEEDCMRFQGSPQFDVRTEAQLEVAPTPTATPSPAATPTRTATATVSEHTPLSSSSPPPLPDLSALYATVQKANKTPTKPPTTATTTPATVAAPRPLGQFLQESLLNGSFFQFMPLPDEPSSDASYTAANPNSEQPTLPMMHLHSLNNINEQHSPPKQHRNLSKSDLSLQRSEIFLENLCRSELVLEKVQNDDVSYDMPNELYDDDFAVRQSNASGCSAYGSVQLEPPPPSSDNQSTPKKQQQQQRFTTKPALSLDINDGPTTTSSSAACRNVSLSCPTTPQEPVQQAAGKSGYSSLGELPLRSDHNESCTLARYRLLKDAVRRSYRKGKHFLLAEKQRLQHSLSLSMSRDQSNQTDQTGAELDTSSSYYASFNLDTLLDESLTTRQQLAQAVSICRQMPELEISAEMVEAERLLLFSSLRKQTPTLPLSDDASLAVRRQAQCFLIDGLRLPVKADASQDMFFNYYYIITVECEGRIRSTQSIECQQGAAVFRDCGLEFYSEGQAEALELRCQIFMLRLRKVSTLSLEPPKTLLKRGSGSLGSGCSSSSSQCEQIVSRFRLHASFTLRASELTPYELVANGTTQCSDRIWLRSSRTWQLPLTPHTKSSNLMPEIALSGRVELRLPKAQHAGYLNVQDAEPRNKHNWNRRWCTLDGLRLCVWQHEHNLSEQPPLLTLQLEHCQQQELDVAPRELCARARSFLLQCVDSQAFFAADTQPELLEWLRRLNEALALARRWLSAC
ncbi:hypothetical protein KR222_007718, partial [Zaprionus bogoriensis]